jgi:hypothetical protein
MQVLSAVAIPLAIIANRLFSSGVAEFDMKDPIPSFHLPIVIPTLLLGGMV